MSRRISIISYTQFYIYTVNPTKTSPIFEYNFGIILNIPALTFSLFFLI